MAVVEWFTLTGIGYVGVSDCLLFSANISVALGIPGCMASPKVKLFKVSTCGDVEKYHPPVIINIGIVKIAAYFR